MDSKQFKTLIYVMMQMTAAICSAILRKTNTMENSLGNLNTLHDSL